MGKEEPIKHPDREFLARFHVNTIILLASCLVLVVLMFYLGVRAGQKCVHSPGPGSHWYKN